MIDFLRKLVNPTVEVRYLGLTVTSSYGALCEPADPLRMQSGTTFHVHCDRDGWVRAFRGNQDDCPSKKAWEEQRRGNP